MKKFSTKILSVLFAALLLLSMVACGGNTDTTTTSDPNGEYNPDYADTVRILTLKGPTGMGMVNIMNDVASNPDSKYDIELIASPDLVKTEILLGNYDIAALPTNVAAALYNSGKADLMVAAVNTLGVLHIVENGNTVTDIKSLKGKTIHATGQGSTPEFILRYVLEKNGINPDTDVTIDFSYIEHSELATYVAGGTVAIAMLPEPNVTAAVAGTSNARVALDLTEEWSKVCDFDIMQGCIVVRREFAEKHPEQLAEFLDEYRASVDYVNQNVDIAAGFMETHGIIPNAAVAKQAIPRCNIVYVEGSAMEESLSKFLTVLYDANKTSVGGKLPDEGFYYKK